MFNKRKIYCVWISDEDYCPLVYFFHKENAEKWKQEFDNNSKLDNPDYESIVSVRELEIEDEE